MPIGWAIVIVVLWLAVAGLAVLVLGVLRQVTAQMQRPPQRRAMMGPTPGTPVPGFAAHDTGGVAFSGAQLRGQPSVLLFLSPGCGPCQELASEMRAAAAGELPASLTVLTDPGGAEALRLPAAVRTVVDPAREIADALEVPGRPFGIAVDDGGIIRATRVPNTLAELSMLASRVMPAAR
jgi:methylamine dehydrogenase accessory protein MauD